MSLQDILDLATQYQVELWFEGDRLRYRAPGGGMPPELRTILSERKEDVLTFLRQKASLEVETYPLSHGQQALWFLHQSDLNSAAYNVAFTGQINSTIDITAFQNAFQALIDRHPALRTTYRAENGVPVQVTVGDSPLWFQHEDANNWDDDQCYAKVRAAYLLPFDLENGPILRIHLFSRNTESHILLITAHHIAVDGWSVWILLDELRNLYASTVSGVPANLPRPPAKYSDFVSWQNDLLNSSTVNELWNYWRNQLDGELPVLSLPIDYERPSIQTSNGSSVNFVVPANITLDLKALAKAEGVTVYMLLFSAFQVFLHHHSGQTEIVTGSPSFGRSKSEYARLIGDFINMMALRVDFSGDPKFTGFLARIRKLILEGLDHQDYPFSLLVANLGGHRDASRSPIFQVTFDVQRLHSFGELAELFIPGKTDAIVDFGGLKLQAYPIPQQEGQFDLGLLMIEVEDVLPGTLKFNTDIFSEATAMRLVEHFLALLNHIVADPTLPLSAYSPLPQDERQRLLVDWNRTQSVYPRELCTHQLFEAQVLRTPDQPAVKHENNTLTYRQLNQRANQLAQHLQALGITQEQFVGVYLERSIDMVVAVLGVMKSGGAYVPMDPMFPPQRIGYMIEDSRMSVIITQQSLVDTLPPHNAQLVVIDTLAPQLALLPDMNLTTPNDPKSLAYVIFTSGSTGRPKGVEITHRSLVNFLTSMQEQPGIQPADVLASVTTLSFDIAGLELYLPLVSGACLVVLSADTAADGSALAEALERFGVTILQATPATWRLLVETGWEGRSGFKILCGGEPLSSQLAKELLGKGGELWNMYGPTETTIWSTIDHVRSSDRIVTIGRPIANTETYILNDHLQPVPVGVTGTLYIGGDGLARGYLHQPELTVEKFIPHPFASQGRIYNSGDLARYLPDGRIVCLGRSDSQVKIRGFRIELGEIEAVLSQHTGIKQAVVVVREDTPGDMRLVAYHISESTIPARELRTFIREKLPPYMVPSAYVFLESFPLTPNGKVNRKALPAPTQGGGDAHKNLQPPTTPTEQIIAETWMKVLNLNQVGVFDNFFDLGGHSLLAMQVVAEIQNKTGFRIEPAYLRFESLGQLAVTLEEKMQGGLS